MSAWFARVIVRVSETSVIKRFSPSTPTAYSTVPYAVLRAKKSWHRAIDSRSEAELRLASSDAGLMEFQEP